MLRREIVPLAWPLSVCQHSCLHACVSPSVCLSSYINAAPIERILAKFGVAIGQETQGLAKISEKISVPLHEDLNLLYVVKSDVGSATLQRTNTWLYFCDKVFSVHYIVASAICTSTIHVEDTLVISMASVIT